MMGVRPIVAIVGRPNVGKSSLFNRLIRSKRSIVADQPGVTRDRIYAEAELEGDRVDRTVILVDTGGFDPESDDPIMRRVLEQTQLAIDESDVVVFVTDGRAGLLPEDQEVGRRLIRAGKEVVVGVNKLDGPQHDDLLSEFHRMGFDAVFPISAAHGRNVGELMAEVVERLAAMEGEGDSLPSAEAETVVSDADGEPDPSLELDGPVESTAEEAPTHVDEPDRPIRVSVIGRPNVGKSSLVNRLLGEDRHLVSDVAGTTVDSIDSSVTWRDRTFVFVDTAGIRRKRSIASRVERFSVFAALKGIDRSDVALLLLDATEPISNQDAKVSAYAGERGRAVILVVSKWDAMGGTGRKAFEQGLRQELPHLAHAPVVFTSSHTGQGLERLLPAVAKVHREFGRRVSTGALNRFVQQIMEHHPPPSKKGKSARIYYMSQVDVRPPRFMVSVNNPQLMHFSYTRYLQNALRKAYGFDGVPLLIHYRSHKGDRDGPSKLREPGKARAARHPAKRATAAKRAQKAGKKALSRKARRGRPDPDR